MAMENKGTCGLITANISKIFGELGIKAETGNQLDISF